MDDGEHSLMATSRMSHAIVIVSHWMDRQSLCFSGKHPIRIQKGQNNWNCNPNPTSGSEWLKRRSRIGALSISGESKVVYESHWRRIMDGFAVDFPQKIRLILRSDIPSHAVFICFIGCLFSPFLIRPGGSVEAVQTVKCSSNIFLYPPSLDSK